MSRALTTPAAQFLMLGLVLAAAGAGVPWHVYTIAGPGASGSYAYGLLAYTVDACFSGSCVRETVQYRDGTSFGTVPDPEHPNLHPHFSKCPSHCGRQKRPSVRSH